MKKYIAPLTVMLIGFTLMTFAITNGHNVIEFKQHFTNGQILMPDYSCIDTLIILDADNLNRDMTDLMQDATKGTDSDIDNVLHTVNSNGLPYCMNFTQYVNFLTGEGYSNIWATHKANVEFQRIAPDSLYNSIIED